MKRGLRFVHGGEKELVEKLGRRDPCPCGSGKRFRPLLPRQRLLSMAPGVTTTGGSRRPTSRHSRTIGIVAALLAAAMPRAASAYCIGWDRTLPNYDPRYYSVSHELRRSTWVIRATVIDETWIGEDGRASRLRPPFQGGASRPMGFDPYLGAFYRLRVVRSFKGHPPPTIRVFSENATDRFWLTPGEDILAFVSSETFETPIGVQMTLDTCGNMSRFPRARRVMAEVLRAARDRE